MEQGLHPSDEFSERSIVSSDTVYDGLIWNVLHDEVDLAPGGPRITRDYVSHPGAVAVVVLDEHDRVLLINQYRHPVGMTLWELPAGLLDVAGEEPLAAAQRELWEEADRTAGNWAVLTDFFLSPGSSSEAMRIFLARDSRLVPEAERHQRTEEEAEMRYSWVPLDEALSAVLGGRIHNPSAVVGILATHAARAQGYTQLRDARVPFEAHPGLRSR
ncbi:NUDIX hydrolase [Glutamicibacter sp. MNS18]|uniref:NUDIX domain-containing protein n=1 Tax=Glutamicibacter sp. MNS18 TaxID=2989817 RepID=UPI002236BDE8|nr:NUDIX hydrolase [Glutamicibacter sp. MNS18]MCW4466951.1 NUDIX hydrolase [Glutamicibacter sp. MNS18]